MSELSLKEVCKKYNLSEVYVRRMYLKGNLPARKISIGNNVFKLMFKEEDIISWRKNVRNSGKRRTDGRSKYTVYLNEKELQVVKPVIDSNKIEIKRSNNVVKK